MEYNCRAFDDVRAERSATPQSSPRRNKPGAPPTAAKQTYANPAPATLQREFRAQSLHSSRAPLLGAQRPRWRRLDRFQQPVLHAILQAAPGNPARKKSRQPNNRANRVAQRRKPQFGPHVFVAQAPNSGGISNAQSQNQVCAQIKSRQPKPPRRKSNRRGCNRPSQAMRKNHSEGSCRPNIPKSDGPPQFMAQKFTDIFLGKNHPHRFATQFDAISLRGDAIPQLDV